MKPAEKKFNYKPREKPKDVDVATTVRKPTKRDEPIVKPIKPDVAIEMVASSGHAWMSDFNKFQPDLKR